MNFSPILDPIIALFSQPADQVILSIFFSVGWMPLAIIFLWGAKELWLYYITGKWGATQKFVLLAIDIPRGNQVTLKAVENMFTYFAGAHGTFNLIETYWEGKFQLSFSFEIVSIEGYTQFLIRCPAHFRNLTESAVYSVYPDAEISEVNDYTEAAPSHFPDDNYDIWGAEFVLTKSDPYPIKTYRDFEYSLGVPEEQFKDPLASLMDLYSTMQRGEQMWLQIIVKPTGFEWMARGDQEISAILKEKTKPKETIFDKIINLILFALSLGENVPASAENDDDSLKMMNLKPKEKKQVEAIQEKISKNGFECKIRMLYLAEKSVKNNPKAVNGFVGYIKQFTDLDLNSFKPDTERTITSTAYFFKDKRLNRRKNSLMQGYKSRSTSIGRNLYILNIEELATLWHFPIEAVVKAPMIQKSPGRRSEPPQNLPFGEKTSPEINIPFMDEKEEDNIFDLNDVSDVKDKKSDNNSNDTVVDKKTTQPTTNTKGSPPANLPFA